MHILDKYTKRKPRLHEDVYNVLWDGLAFESFVGWLCIGCCYLVGICLALLDNWCYKADKIFKLGACVIEAVFQWTFEKGMVSVYQKMLLEVNMII